jgi:tripartite-type tricarboxylate transporter receptor subunit TctC
MKPLLATLVAMFGVAFGTSSIVAADEVQDFYRTHNVNVVIGHEPGSGFDVYGRALARHMGRHLPGAPSFIPQNMVGAVGLNAANWTYNLAPKDGTVISIFAHTVLLEPLLGVGAGKFDANNFNWIGNMDQVVGICGVSRSAGVNSYEELLRREVLFGSSGVGAAGPLSQFPLALRNLTGAKIKMIQGYKGSAEIRLAISRGEVDGICGLPISTLKTEWRSELQTNSFKMLLQLGLEKNSELLDVPLVYEYAKDAEDRYVFDLIFGIQAVGRVFVAPPGTPVNRVKALQAAFMRTMLDPEFLADAAKMDLNLKPSSGEDARMLVKRFYASPKAAIDRAKQAIKAD